MSSSLGAQKTPSPPHFVSFHHVWLAGGKAEAAQETRHLVSPSYFGIVGVSVCQQCQPQDLKGSQQSLLHPN